jgi:predicted O-methyltransferase YrrM
MLESLKDIVKKSIPYDVLKLHRDRKALRSWEKIGRSSPPPHVVKEALIRDYARAFNTRILVETGTYLGDMVYAMRKSFSRILSFELDQTLYEQARKRFAADDHIEIIQGDSGLLLADYLTARGELNTPIKRELEHIFEHHVAGHVILIDDARCFTGQSDYPTLDELQRVVNERTQGWQFSVEDDVVRIHPVN